MKTAIFLTRLLIQSYRYFISPLLGARCRFEPTCSTYALEALSSHGFIGGCWLSFRRLAKCHPWGDSGYDPVPKTKCANVHQRGDAI